MSLVESLSGYSGLRSVTVRSIINTAPYRYKEYSIPKRSGGQRSIAQPAKEVKLLQRAFVDIYCAKIPTHPAATAYLQGKSILDNAHPHAGSGPLLKMDFADFFPSIRSRDWINYCTDHGLLENEDDRELAGRLLFKGKRNSTQLRLAIGAPSSPSLSNILMFDFDRRLIERIADDRVVYTRYADDLTFSAPRTGYLLGIQKAVADTLKKLPYPRLQVNAEKTTYITRKYARRVTGLVLANDGRVTIGWDQKRVLSSAVHRVVCGRLEFEERQRLAGYLAYVNAVEPGFLTVLRRKYGSKVIREIQHTVVIPAKAGISV